MFPLAAALRNKSSAKSIGNEFRSQVTTEIKFKRYQESGVFEQQTMSIRIHGA